MTKITHISEHKKYRSKFTVPKLPDSFLVAAEVPGLPDVGVPVAFYLRRRRGFAEIWIQYIGRFSLNASISYGIKPKNFAEARAWVRDFSIRHGFHLYEITRKK